MKKLIINALLILAVILLVIAFIWGLSKLRAVETTDKQMQENEEQQTEQVAEQKEVVQQTQVKVSVGNATKNTTNASKPATNDEDVNDFFNEI